MFSFLKDSSSSVLPFKSMVMLLMKDSRSCALWCVLVVLSRRPPTLSVVAVACKQHNTLSYTSQQTHSQHFYFDKRWSENWKLFLIISDPRMAQLAPTAEDHGVFYSQVNELQFLHRYYNKCIYCSQNKLSSVCVCVIHDHTLSCSSLMSSLIFMISASSMSARLLLSSSVLL